MIADPVSKTRGWSPLTIVLTAAVVAFWAGLGAVVLPVVAVESLRHAGIIRR